MRSHADHPGGLTSQITVPDQVQAQACFVKAAQLCFALVLVNTNALCVMQSAELILWMYAFQYYSYPAALFGTLLFGSGASGYLQYRQRMRLVTLLTKRQLVPVLYEKFVRALLAKQLVPGDVIVVQKGRAACDMVLLRGRCLVEESMLSGEV